MIPSIGRSPLQALPRLGTTLGIDLRTKRDDLLPVAGGGNKLRKISRIVDHARATGSNALVTTGGAQSNHARVTAVTAAALGWRCHLVLHGSPDDLENPTGNLLLMVLAGADITIVEPDEIASAMKDAIDRLSEEGCEPYEIPGGGHSVHGAMAYVDAISEVSDQANGWEPDFIVHASGTGATQAGIIAGCVRQGWPTRVIGISVARRNPRGTDAVWQSVDEVARVLDLPMEPSIVDFRDSWVGEGYELADSRVLDTIRTAAGIEGLVLDPTYTGKAFTALNDLVDTGEIPKGSRVLFWHTGGLLNLMSSRYLEHISASR